jgi:Tfp pilus assembly major pilin PilA
MDGVLIEESSPDLSPVSPLLVEENKDISRPDKTPSLRIPLENAFTMDCDCILDSIATEEENNNSDDDRIELNESAFMNGGCFGFAYMELLVSKETNKIVNPILFAKDLSLKEANSIIWLEKIEKNSIIGNDLDPKENSINQRYEDLISGKPIYFLLDPSKSPPHEDKMLFTVHAIKIQSTKEENGQSIPICTFDENSMKIMDILPYHQQTTDQQCTESTISQFSWNATNKLEEQKRSLLSSSSFPPSGQEKEFSSVSFQADYTTKPFLFLLWKPDTDSSDNTSSAELERKLQIISSIPMESHRNNDDENEEELNSFLFSLQFNSSLLLNCSSFFEFRTHPVFNRETIRKPLEIRVRESNDVDDETAQQQGEEEIQESISSSYYLQSWKLFVILILLIPSLKLFPRLQEIFIVSRPRSDPSDYSLQMKKNLLVSPSDQPLVRVPVVVHVHEEEEQHVDHVRSLFSDLIEKEEVQLRVSSPLSVLIVEETEVKENEDEETELISAVTTTAVILLTEAESSLSIDNDCPLPKFLDDGNQSAEGEIMNDEQCSNEPSQSNEHGTNDEDMVNQESNNETITTIVVEGENSTSEQNHGIEYSTINDHQGSTTQNSNETVNNSDKKVEEPENPPTPQKEEEENNKTVPEKDGSIDILSILVKLFKFSLIYGLLFFFLFVLLTVGGLF